ncbi:MAG TPA: hypothetical protein VM030_08975 [Acidimicrobiales bacterium]|nr:hypothetical protein [Acidimicrobiales bacterium]
MAATDYGPWEPLTPEGGSALFGGCDAQWWIAGGWAIDLLLGHQHRPHGDLDVLVLRSDQGVVRAHLDGWDVHAADPPGHLRPWPIGEVLPASVHDVWCRPSPSSPWAFQLMIDDTDGDDWLFRRDHRIRRPLSTLAGRASRPGMAVLTPEIQLLYKSKGLRERDVDDFHTALPLMTADERSWLRQALAAGTPDHPWLDHL